MAFHENSPTMFHSSNNVFADYIGVSYSQQSVNDAGRISEMMFSPADFAHSQDNLTGSSMKIMTNGLPPKWNPNSFTTKCQVCHSRFSKILRRKHHCRQCGSLVCNDCSNVRDYVPGYKDKKVRVCTFCNTKNLDLRRSKMQANPNQVMSATTISNP